MSGVPSDRHARYEALLSSFDLFDPALQEADLWDFFDWVREHHPVARTSALGGVWIVSRYEDVARVLQSPEDFSSRAVVWPFHEGDSLPLNLDPPDHGAYRHLLAPMFSPAEALRMEGLLRTTCRLLMEPIAATGGCEVVADFARPLPARAFLQHFDIAPDRLDEMIESAGNAFRLPEDATGYERLRTSSETVTAYFRDLVEERRRHPGGADVPSRLVRAEVHGRPLTDDEIVNMLNLLMAASLDTTTSSLSNMLTWLASHPDRRDELVADPALIPAAVEELLRFEPMLFNGRMVRRDVVLHGVQLKAGDRLMMLGAAAMRDPRSFQAPGEVRFDRGPNRHLVFGAGPHRCLGLHQARLTLRVALEEWHRSFPRYGLRPGTSPRRRLTMVMSVAEAELSVES